MLLMYIYTYIHVFMCTDNEAGPVNHPSDGSGDHSVMMTDTGKNLCLHIHDIYKLPYYTLFNTRPCPLSVPLLYSLRKS